MISNLMLAVAVATGVCLGGIAEDCATPGMTEDSPEARVKMQQFMEGDSVFIENAGQWPDSSIKFALDSRGANVGLTDRGPRFQLFRLFVLYICAEGVDVM